ncbi:YjzD family protein [Fictibacillus sp. Mic-4]|uniref:YjzD family protein n=1 Tax=Fictibacillus sp. Mic-4 TaxID=3132826 RepID=UPI003CF1EC14
MRFIWTLIWSFLLSNMAFYVLGSMQGGKFDFTTASIFGVVFALFITVVGEMLPKEVEEH